MKIGDPWLLLPQNCWKWCIHCCLDGTHYERLGKILTTKTNNKINTPNYNIPSNINKQTNNYTMQDHAKQRYIFGHLSLIRSLALNMSSTELPRWETTKIGCLSKKRDFGVCFLGHLSFWVSGIESPLIFSIQKIRKTKYTNTWLNCILLIDWIKITYLIIYMALVPSYNLPKIHGFMS